MTSDVARKLEKESIHNEGWLAILDAALRSGRLEGKESSCIFSIRKLLATSGDQF